ncbi:MAG: DUF4147 domain-containing protein [Anaerolineales bacterium]|nr:DUF4147 domain-containing protein [Anaerolineales bacterium]
MSYRVLMIAPTSFFLDYGCHVRILEEARVLQKLGHRVKIVTYPFGRDLPGLDIERALPIPFRPRHEVGPARSKLLLDALLALKTLHVALHFKPDLIHAHLHEGALIGGVVSRLLRVPLVFDLQGSMTSEMVDHRFIAANGLAFKLAYWLEARIVHLPRLILTSSRNAARVLMDEFHISAEKIVVLSDCVDADAFVPIESSQLACRVEELRARLTIPQARRVVVYIGLLDEYRGTDVMLRAAARVIERGADAHFVIIGFPNVERYRAMARELGIADRVTFPGRVDYADAPLWLSLGELALEPKMSATEAAGKVLNYMALGLPVVAFDIPVMREYLGEYGVYAPLGDASAFADQIQTLLNDPARAREIGCAVRARDPIVRVGTRGARDRKSIPGDSKVNQRESAHAIFRAALAAADPRQAVHRAMQRDGNRLRVQDREYDLARVKHIFVIGFGKASATMAQAAEEILGDKITRGWINVKYAHAAPLATDKIHLHQAGHPLLDQNGLDGTRKILEILDAAMADDLIVCLISGGGSALFELPSPDVSLEDLRTLNDALLRCGATINEINTLRKHISQVKGGQLARRAGKAQLVALILSDVIGSPLDTIASGPTAPDATTFADARAVIEQRGLRGQIPARIFAHIERGNVLDTPKTGDPIFARVQNVVIADLTIACDAAMQTARQFGYHALLLSSFVQGEAREFAKFLAAIAREINASNRPVAKPTCIVCGGETTVTIRGKGKGGRNQEIALAAAIEIAGTSNVVILSGGTDGTDGPTDAAGALCDGETIARASAIGMDAHAFLANNDAYNFFAPLGDLVMTGPTGTNVNDVIVLLVE